MNKTHFKNNYLKYFEQLIHAPILSLTTNKEDTIQIKYLKDDKEKLLTIKANIQRDDNDGLLDFQFNFNAKSAFEEELEALAEPVIEMLDEISLFIAKDAFCKEQALELRYNQDQYLHILIYTNMVDMTLEFFDSKLEVEKFKRISF